jgi:hypothetical protein
LTGLHQVDRPGYHPADVDRAEHTLTGLAATFAAKDLQVCTDRLIAHLDPDGSRPRDDLNHDRRHVELRARADGSWTGQLQLTGAAGAKLHALLSPLAKPRLTDAGPDGDPDGDPGGDPVAAVELRTYGQRLHDALEDLCDRLLRAGTIPDSGGTPATVIVTLGLDDLLARTGYGSSSDGTLLSTPPDPAARHRSRDHPRRTQQHRGGAQPGPVPADRQPHPNPRPDRPRCRVQLPRL